MAGGIPDLQGTHREREREREIGYERVDRAKATHTQKKYKSEPCSKRLNNGMD